ncbi:hypothetical protein TNCV_842631 [Trichonephila clavipes]|nr:hypothetical protein TNCV_842631 [Trichonephila clavipes]
MPRNLQKHDRGKEKKELLKKMKEAIIDIKMNPHRPKKPASDESTTDEEEMIVTTWKMKLNQTRLRETKLKTY